MNKPSEKPQEIVFASLNKGKFEELKDAFAPLNITLLPQGQFNVPEVAETGLTFVENALIKARHAAEHTQLPALADDSGITVKVLRGAPGLYSSRFAHEHATDEENLQHLLKLMKHTEERKARYVCVLAWCSHAKDPAPIITQGTWSGEIAQTPSGDGGFGYDPIFLLPDNRTAAQLSLEEKNQQSHRSKAVSKMYRKLASL